MYFRKLNGEGFYLSPADVNNEAEALCKWMNEDEAIAHFNGFYNSLVSYEKCAEKLAKWAEGPFFFSIVSDNNEFMGHISVFNIGHNDLYGTIGIYLAKEYRGRGFGKKALKLVIEYLFNATRFEAIHIEVFSFNKKAYEIYKSLGFKVAGVYHNSLYHMSELKDIIMMEMLRKDYTSKR